MYDTEPTIEPTRLSSARHDSVTARCIGTSSVSFEKARFPVKNPFPSASNDVSYKAVSRSIPQHIHGFGVRGGPSLTWCYAANSNMCDGTQRNPLVVEHRWLTSCFSPRRSISGIGGGKRERNKNKMGGDGTDAPPTAEPCIHPSSAAQRGDEHSGSLARPGRSSTADANQPSSQTGGQASLVQPIPTRTAPIAKT